MLFKFEKRDWASDYLTQGILPSWNNSGNYVGISALKNSDILTAVSHIASNVARFPIVALDKQNRNKTPEEVDYLINKSPNGTIRKPILKLNKKPVYAKQIQAKINIITGSLFCKNFTPSPPKSQNRHSRYLR